MARHGNRIICSFFCGVLLFWLDFLVAGSLTGELDKSEGTVEDQFVYTLSVQGNAEGEPQFPAVNGVEVQRGGTSQSVSIVNGRMSKEVQYQFSLLVSKLGTYAIPSIELKVDGKVEQTLPLEFKVTGTASPSQERADQSLFLERSFSKTKVYSGESILVSTRLFRRVRMMSAEPDFWNFPESFQVKKLEGQKTYNKTLAGQEYEVTEISSILLPSKPGHFDITPAQLDARFASGQRRSNGLLDELLTPSQSVSKRFRSEAAVIEVLPLPLADRRPDFSGLVGEFQGRADVSSRSLAAAGETVTVTLVIEGKGSTNGMADPNINFGTKAKVYKDKPQSNDTYSAGEGVYGKRIYKLAVVPLESGIIELGVVKVQYFNTALGQYQDLLIELGSVQVDGSLSASALKSSNSPAQMKTQEQAAKAENPPLAKEVQSLATDLLEPRSVTRLKAKDTIQWIDILGALCFVMGGLVSLGWGGRQIYLGRQGKKLEIQKKSALALSQAQQQLKSAQEFIGQQKTQAAAGLAQKLIRQYLGDRFNIYGTTLTLKDLEFNLQKKGLDADTLLAMRGVWQNLDQMLFAPENASSEQGQAVLRKLGELLHEVELRCDH